MDAVRRESGPLSPELKELTRTAVRVALPNGFGDSAATKEEFLGHLTEYLSSLGLDDVPVQVTFPARFVQTSSLGGGIGLAAGAVAAVGKSGVCPDRPKTRRGFVAKLAGVGFVAALISALGPVGKRALAACGWCGGLCGDCRVVYCFQGDLWVEFWCCFAQTHQYCDGFCTGYRQQQCALQCNCI